MKSKSELRREEIDAHNSAYEKERERLSCMSQEERTREMVSKGIKSAIKDLKPQIDDLLGAPKK